MEELLVVRVDPGKRAKVPAKEYLDSIETKVKDLDLQCKYLVVFDDVVDVYTVNSDRMLTSSITATSLLETDET